MWLFEVHTGTLLEHGKPKENPAPAHTTTPAEPWPVLGKFNRVENTSRCQSLLILPDPAAEIACICLLRASALLLPAIVVRDISIKYLLPGLTKG